MALAGIITFIAGWVICVWFNNIELPKYIFEFSKIVVVTLFCGILYTVLNLSFKMDYAKELIKRVIK
jgi:hypothetical protein